MDIQKPAENSRKIRKISDCPELIHEAAGWFHSKWGVPAEEYIKSMKESLDLSSPIPQWYVITEEDSIIAGAGIIENDFHSRKDLSPNLCACTWRNPSDARESPASFSPLSAMTCSRKALIPCISSQTTPHFTSAMAGSFCAPYRPKSQTPSLFPSECTPAKHLCRGPFSPRKRKYKLLSSFSPRKRESKPSATSLPGNASLSPQPLLSQGTGVSFR